MDSLSEPDKLQEGSQEDRGEREGGKGEGKWESPRGEGDWEVSQEFVQLPGYAGLRS